MKYLILSSMIMIVISGCKQSFVKKNKLAFEDRIFDVVLSENKINQEYCFEIIDTVGTHKYYMVNLGSIEIRGSKTSFVLNTVLSGIKTISANSYVHLFSGKGDKIGYYYIGGAIQILPRIQGNDLIFEKNNSDCNQTTLINFKDSIPQNIFINCKELQGRMFGDIYKFEK